MFIFVVAVVHAQMQSARVQFENVFPHNRREELVTFQNQYAAVPQVIISLVGLHISNEPKSISAFATVQAVTQKGFTVVFESGNEKIDEAEYLWVAALDDRIHMRCLRADEDAVIKFGREFWEIPQVNLFLSGLSKENDLKLQLTADQITTQQFQLRLLKQPKISISFCYIAGPPSVIKSKKISNLNQKSDEFVEIQSEETLIYGFSKIQNYYGTISIQIGYKEYIQNPGIGISQIDLQFTQLKTQQMQCPIAYFECNYQGEFIDLCEKGISDSWKKIKSIKVKKHRDSFPLYTGYKLKVIDVACVNDIQSFLEDVKFSKQ